MADENKAVPPEMLDELRTAVTRHILGLPSPPGARVPIIECEGQNVRVIATGYVEQVVVQEIRGF